MLSPVEGRGTNPLPGQRSVLSIEEFKTSTSRQSPPMSEKPINPLRRRMLEDMAVRRLGEEDQVQRSGQPALTRCEEC